MSEAVTGGDKPTTFHRSPPNRPVLSSAPLADLVPTKMIAPSPVAEKPEDAVDEHVDAEDDDGDEDEGGADPVATGESLPLLCCFA